MSIYRLCSKNNLQTIYLRQTIGRWYLFFVWLKNIFVILWQIINKQFMCFMFDKQMIVGGKLLIRIAYKIK